MRQPLPAGLTLDDVRREIDAIDDTLLELLARRFAMVDHVKALKQSLAAAGSPLRPAREASVLRRLVTNGAAAGLNPDLLVRLWPAIFSEATRIQNPVTIHVSKRLSQTIGNRLRIRDYFPLMQVEECRDEAQAILEVDANANDICIVECDAPWIAPWRASATKARVMAALPFLADEPQPRLLVLGHAPAEPSGEDETLIATNGSLPREFQLKPRWQVKSGDFRLTALNGFLSEKESPLLGLIRANGSLGLKIVGRYPAPMERAP